MSICITSHPFIGDLVELKYHDVSSRSSLFTFVLLCRRLFRQQFGKYFTGPANLHLFLPVRLHLTFTDGSVYEPAKITGLELPGRASLPLAGGAFLDCPAGSAVPAILTLSRNQKIHLPFHIRWYGSPGLLVTVDRLDRGAEQLRHLFLGLVQLLTKTDELFAVHGEFRQPVR